MSIGHDNRVGPYPSLVANDIRRVHRLLAEGASVPQVAEVMQISKRTVYRYRGARIVTTFIAGWPMTFLCYPKRMPVLIAGGTHR